MPELDQWASELKIKLRKFVENNVIQSELKQQTSEDLYQQAQYDFINEEKLNSSDSEALATDNAAMASDTELLQPMSLKIENRKDKLKKEVKLTVVKGDSDER